MLQRTTLANGIKIVTEKISHVHSVSLGIWVKAGSRYEKKEENGTSHFIEHMLFKGTAQHNALDIAKTIDSVGGVINAFTGKEYTCLYIKVLNQYLFLAIDLLADIFLNSLFTPEEIEKEKSVIMQEIHMIKDTPDEYIQDLFNQAYFTEHPLGYPILGELEIIERLNKNRLLKFFGAQYLHPPRIIVAAAGNVDHQQLIDSVGNHFEKMNLKQIKVNQDPFLPQKTFLLNYRPLEQVHICIGTKGLSQLDPSRYALYVLNTLLGGSMSSRLFQEIRENRGLAYTIYSFMASFLDTGLFGIYMGVKKDMVKKAIPIVLEELEELKANKLDDLELKRAKEQLKGNMLLASESSDNRMSRYAKCEIYYDKYIPIDEVVKGIENVTVEDIQALCQKIFIKDYFNYTILGPLDANDLPEKEMEIN
jgi:predicted Zn-dependent peptidase